MKKLIILFYILFFSFPTFSQDIHGTIVSDSGNLTVVKLWGTHYERGFAYGYLCGNKILDMYNNYYLPNFGPYMAMAHSVVAGGTLFRIDSAFFDEAKGVINGMDSAGLSTINIDHIDLIVGNCMLELLNMLKCNPKISMGCSSLMSWGSSTASTDLNGHSVITRHLDWDNDPVLIANQTMVIHFPSETDEQPWIAIGFAGQISALSGVNQYFGTFQHMMSDFSGSITVGTLYEPIWFSLRKALEKKDFNGDGEHNADDVHDVLTSNPGGTADGYIISTLARSTSGSSEKIAEVAEVAPVAPYNVFRSNNFPDSIPADNLYAANYEIKRNDHYHFCTRYTNVIAALGTGLGIGSQENWEIMRDTSVSLQPSGNIQMMQYMPDDGVLKLSVFKHGKPAYKNPPDTWMFSELFSNPQGFSIEPLALNMNLFPNPASEKLNIEFYCYTAGKCDIHIYDVTGKLLISNQYLINAGGIQHFNFSVHGLRSGVYILQIESPENSVTGRFVVIE